MNIIYAEKPSLGRTIAGALGVNNRGDGCMRGSWKNEETIVTWGFGHMGGLIMPEGYNPDYRSWSKRPKPFFPTEYKVEPRGDAQVRKQLELMKENLVPGNTVICATDDDREGELIFAYVCDLIGFSGHYERVKIDSLTPNGIRKAFDALIPGEERRFIVDAGRARSIADWAVGINLTTSATTHFMDGARKVMSVGRVQTPTLAMIVERELAIRSHQSKPLFTPSAKVKLPTGETYTAKHTGAPFDDPERCAAIMTRVKGRKLEIFDITSKEKLTAAPLLYSQTTLQMDANKKLGYTAQQTLDYSQELYERGIITYPRTSSQHLTSDMEPQAGAVMDALGRTREYGELVAGGDPTNFPAGTCDDSKVESHFAILPTGRTLSGVSSGAGALYNLVALSLIRLYYPPAISENTTVRHRPVDENGQPIPAPIETAETPSETTDAQNAGAKDGVTQDIAALDDDDADEDDAENSSASGRTKDSELGYDVFEAKGTVVRSPGWWVVDAMPKPKDPLPVLEVGQVLPATYQQKKSETKPPKRYTDETLVAAMKSAGKNIEDKNLAAILADPQHTGIGTDATRAGIIETLTRRGFIKRVKKQIHATDFGILVIETLPVEDLKSPLLTALWEQRLKSIEKGQDSLGSFIADIEEKTRTWCGEIHSSQKRITLLSDEDKDLEGCVCPLCGSQLVYTTFGVGCIAFKRTKCAYKIWGKVAGKTLTKKQLAALIKNGRTPVLKGFKSKAGKAFDTALVLERETGRVNFDFSEVPREGSATQSSAPATGVVQDTAEGNKTQ